MPRRQIVPRRWYIARGNPGEIVALARALQRGDGILLIEPLPPEPMRQLAAIARLREIPIVEERHGTARRIHDIHELRAALLARTPLILLSPIYPTASHPSWKPLPRMRAAALARLAGRRLIALGGMNDVRFAKLAPLGFIAWAGISGFRT